MYKKIENKIKNNINKDILFLLNKTRFFDDIYKILDSEYFVNNYKSRKYWHNIINNFFKFKVEEYFGIEYEDKKLLNFIHENTFKLNIKISQNKLQEIFNKYEYAINLYDRFKRNSISEKEFKQLVKFTGNDFYIL